MYSSLHTNGFLFNMSDIRVKQHPTLGILVCTDGHVMTYSNKLNKPYWTIGYKTNRGYRAVKFKNKSYLVHRLVAETYIPNPNNLPEIDHFPDRTRENNNYLNLRWADRTIQNRNNAKCDRVTSRGWKHTYENLQEYKHSYNTSIREKHRVYQSRYYKENREKCQAIAKKIL